MPPLLLIAFDLTLARGFPQDVVAVSTELADLVARAEQPWHRREPFIDDRPPSEYERCEIWLVTDDGIGLVSRRGPERWVTQSEVFDRLRH